MGSYLTAAVGALLLSAPIASAESAPVAQQQRQEQPAAARAQPTPAPTATDVDKLPVSLDRIREQLAHEPAFSINLLHALDIPVFRTEARGNLVFKIDLNAWKDDNVGSYVRPGVNRWHYDFMKMVNPDLPAGYGPGSGMDVLPAIQSAISGVRHAFQERERARVREQIREELRAIEDARRAAGLPPLADASTQQPAKQDPASQDPSSTGSPNATNPNGTSSPAPQPSIKVTPPLANPPDVP